MDRDAFDEQSARMNALRHRVARTLYEDGAVITRPEWPDLPAERRRPWLADADRIIPIVLEACAGVADETDPEKPTNYRHRREHISAAIKGLMVGMPSDDPESGDTS